MKTEREKMLAGELYDPANTELVAARKRARDLCAQALQIPLEAGRFFEDGDRADAQPVVIVNQAFASRMFPDREALKQAWDAFRADPDWQAGKAASEVEGLLTSKVTSVILEPTDYSPLK